MSSEQHNLTAEHDVRDAVQSIINQLIAFDSSTKQRILRTVATFFDMPSHSFKQNDSAASTVRAPRDPHFGEDSELSPKDFLFQKQPATDVDRVACLAYYLTHFRDIPHFKTVDISRLNTEAAQMKFSNAAYAVTNATNAGLLVSAGKGQKQLSAIGERYVEALPDAVAAKEIRASMSKKRSNGKRKKSKSKQS